MSFFKRVNVFTMSPREVQQTIEKTSMVIVWIPIPAGKICTLGVLKGVSYGCMKIRDLCATEPGNPLC